MRVCILSLDKNFWTNVLWRGIWHGASSWLVLDKFRDHGHRSEVHCHRMRNVPFSVWMHILRWHHLWMQVMAWRVFDCLSSSLCYSGQCDLEWGLSSSLMYVVAYVENSTNQSSCLMKVQHNVSIINWAIDHVPLSFADSFRWYKRVENNGWRIVSDKLISQITRSADPLTLETSSKKFDFRHSKVWFDDRHLRQICVCNRDTVKFFVTLWVHWSRHDITQH